MRKTTLLVVFLAHEIAVSRMRHSSSATVDQYSGGKINVRPRAIPWLPASKSFSRSTT